MQMMPIWEIYHAEARTGAWPLTLHAVGQPSADKYAMVNAQGRERRSSRSRGERRRGKDSDSRASREVGEGGRIRLHDKILH